MPICSREHEIETWKMIDQIVEDKLNAYPNQLDEDIELLDLDKQKGYILGRNQRNCVKFRKTEKEVLMYLKHNAEMALKLLKL